MTRALFLDRDGTLIVDVGYPRDPDAVELLPGAAATLAALPADVALVIVTNQSGLARGLVTPAEAAAVQAEVERQFAAAGVRFAGVYVCPHGPDDGCPCRKPAPGMLRDAARDLGLDLGRSLMIGDKAADVAAGRAAGCAVTLRFAEASGPNVDVVGWPAAGATLAAFFAA
ncbi:MAG: HAD-IIIA family hydrolase [Myxococcales bacterium]|nr:HAD-IIIA family hydrolase [Myxococcales bacterium]